LVRSYFNVGVAFVRWPLIVSVPILPTPDAPGARVPPLLTRTAPLMAPAPPSVALEKTVHSEGEFVPLRNKAPASTAFVPVKELLPLRVSVPLPSLLTQMALPALLALLRIVPLKTELRLLPPTLKTVFPAPVPAV